MEWTIRTFVEARTATERVLEQLGLGSYLFDVEPRDDGWEVKIECQGREGWKVTRVAVDRDALERSLHDGAARERLLATFRDRIGDCALPPDGGEAR
jgi:hypothetical protein